LCGDNGVEGGRRNEPAVSTAAYRLKIGIGSNGGGLYLRHDDATAATH
jgi:hypothetical protein